jgi:hypothetical protein
VSVRHSIEFRWLDDTAIPTCSIVCVACIEIYRLSSETAVCAAGSGPNVSLFVSIYNAAIPMVILLCGILTHIHREGSHAIDIPALTRPFGIRLLGGSAFLHPLCQYQKDYQRNESWRLSNTAIVPTCSVTYYCMYNDLPTIQRTCVQWTSTVCRQIWA